MAGPGAAQRPGEPSAAAPRSAHSASCRPSRLAAAGAPKTRGRSNLLALDILERELAPSLARAKAYFGARSTSSTSKSSTRAMDPFEDFVLSGAEAAPPARRALVSQH
jgi:hypothetical protein